MKILTSRKDGLTLVELLIATIMMAIVMLGVVAIDYTIRRTQKTSSKSSEVEMRVTAAMTHILRNALLATGYKGNEGIRPINTDTSTGNGSICIRQDVGTPAILTDDVWIRYDCDMDATPKRILYCSDIGDIQPNYPNCPDTGALACSGTEFELMSHLDTCKFYFWADDSAATPKLYLEVKVKSINDTSKAADPITNPSFTMTSEVSPLGHTY